MSPILRNAAIATGLTLLPAAVGAAWYAYERPRTLPQRMSARMRGLFHEAPEPEAMVDRISRRLDQLQLQLDSYSHHAASYARSTTTQQRSIAGLAVALLVPAVLVPMLFPEKIAELRDRARTSVDEEEEQVERELSRLSERLETLSENIEEQRDTGFDAVAREAQRNPKK